MTTEQPDDRGSACSRFALLIVTALLAGCAAPTSLDRAALNSARPAGEAIALPPPGGPAMLDVIERRYSNAIQQDIVLAASSAAPGQNLLRVQLFGPVGSDGGDTTLANPPLAEARIDREMRQLLPGIAMRRSELYAQNAYGPFGYAIGRHGARDMCLYAWQRISAPQEGAPFAARGSVQTRLRLCQEGASEQDLLSVMYGYTINASFPGTAWNPFGAPPPADPRLGVTGQPIYPVGMLHSTTVLAPPPPPPAPRRQPRATPVERPAEPQPVPLEPFGPSVPAPPAPSGTAPIVPAPAR